MKNAIEKLATAADSRDYLNHLTVVKRSIKPPINLDKSNGLYNIMDGNGNVILSCTKEIYQIFQEL